jgi:ATP-dependent Clp protease adaptor protein ClpS
MPGPCQLASFARRPPSAPAPMPATIPYTLPEVAVEETTETAPLWNVVLLNDDDHTYEYVVEMLVKLFGVLPERAFGCACEVDQHGRAVVETTSKERAELKQEQIHAYGPDWRIPRCKGSMSAAIEPAT